MAAKVGTIQGEIHADVPDNNLPAVITDQALTTPQLMQLAIQRMDGSNAASMVDVLERLVGLQERMEERAAVKAFHDAFAKFKTEVKPIHKNKSSKETGGGSGAKFNYTYASLDYIASVVDPLLADVGLSYSWDTSVDGQKMKTTCTLRHAGGHSVSSSFECPISSSLPVGDQQKYGAVGQYGRRYSLVQVLGLTTTDDDTDAQLGTDRGPMQTITAAQATEIDTLLRETNTKESDWLEYYGVDSVMDLPAKMFKPAVNQLKRKKVAA